MVSHSSSEAKYRALATITCEIQWLQFLLNDLRIPFVPTNLYCDNLSTIRITENPVYHERTKYIEIDCHLIGQKLQQGVIVLMTVSSQNQFADCFTSFTYNFFSEVKVDGMIFHYFSETIMNKLCLYLMECFNAMHLMVRENEWKDHDIMLLFVFYEGLRPSTDHDHGGDSAIFFSLSCA
ncbi:zinc finger protein CONSTANS-LIKE 4-like [Hibiscus syriacus]|uniref:Zinc finger protein CONSTANS-LIKE 4-like n=1 Tax=Hibiscus syriacus TaxID=106335 RepID=A0A6A2XCI6_HIBSY|nr:zinc finger protein CONSTANS-LIKE 4-like [Hibiscus syriacus]